MRHESPPDLSRLSRCPQAVSRLSTSRSAGVEHQALATRDIRLGKPDQVTGEESRACSDSESLHILPYVSA